MALEYLPPGRLGLGAGELPGGRGWAPPAPLRWPFGGGLTDYMRPVRASLAQVLFGASMEPSSRPHATLLHWPCDGRLIKPMRRVRDGKACAFAKYLHY